MRKEALRYLLGKPILLTLEEEAAHRANLEEPHLGAWVSRKEWHFNCLVADYLRSNYVLLA
jgi:hypothetical protein